MSSKQVFTGSVVFIGFMYFAIFFITFMYIKHELPKIKRIGSVAEQKARRRYLIALFIVSTIPVLNMFLPFYATITSFVTLCKLLSKEFSTTVQNLFRS